MPRRRTANLAKSYKNGRRALIRYPPKASSLRQRMIVPACDAHSASRARQHPEVFSMASDREGRLFRIIIQVQRTQLFSFSSAG